MKKQMPAIDLEQLKSILSAADFELDKGIVSTRGKNKGCLRERKPRVTRRVVAREKVTNKYVSFYKDIIEVDEIQGKTAFLWRHVAACCLWPGPERRQNY